MDTVTYKEILLGAADLAGLDQNNIAALDAAILRNLISKRLTTAWHWQKWPDLCRCEKRYFRPVYSSTATYNTGDEVYFPATCSYYACINPNTIGIPCADAFSNPTYASWQAIDVCYSGDNYDPTASYLAGTIVYDPTTDAFYWACQPSQGQALYNNLAYWAVINPFIRNVSLTQTNQTVIGAVLNVWDRNVRADMRARRVLWKKTENGVQVISAVPFVWVEFRVPAPRLFGQNYSATAIYSQGQQFYWTVDGNFYNVLATTTAGDTPVSQPAEFANVGIPTIFKGYLEAGAAADYLGSDNKNDEGDRLQTLAQGYLDNETTVLRGQEDQVESTVVLTR